MSFFDQILSNWDDLALESDKKFSQGFLCLQIFSTTLFLDLEIYTKFKVYENNKN